jgi:hypothetical protein
MIAKTFAEYYKFEVKTKVREIFEESIVFPSIAICNVNNMPTRAARQFIKSFYENRYQNITIETYSDIYELDKAGIINSYDDQFISYLTYDPSFNETLRRSFGYNEEAILECTFYNLPCDLENWFTWYIKFSQVR